MATCTGLLVHCASAAACQEPPLRRGRPCALERCSVSRRSAVAVGNTPAALRPGGPILELAGGVERRSRGAARRSVAETAVKAAKTMGMFRPLESLNSARIERMTPSMDCSENTDFQSWTVSYSHASFLSKPCWFRKWRAGRAEGRAVIHVRNSDGHVYPTDSVGT